MPNVTVTDFIDVGDPNAPIGSSAWCKASHLHLCATKRETRARVSDLKYHLIEFRKFEFWKQLAARNGQPFLSWEDYVQHREPEGLGMTVAVIDAVMQAPDDNALLQTLLTVPRAKPENHAGPGRGHKTLANSYRLPTGSTSPARIIARLKRDRPDLVERLARGEFRSARAAAREAGWVIEVSALVLLRRAWKKATPEQRAAFVAEIES